MKLIVLIYFVYVTQHFHGSVLSLLIDLLKLVLGWCGAFKVQTPLSRINGTLRKPNSTGFKSFKFIFLKQEDIFF